MERVVCDDWQNVLPKYGDGTFDACLTDPPYGITGDDDDYVAINFLPEIYRVLKPDSALMMCVGQATLREFWNEAERVGFRWLNTIVWHYKNTIKRERKRLAIQYDPILYFAKGDFTHRLDDVRVPYLHPERLKYPCNNSKMKGWMPNPDGAICGDVWEFPAVNAGNPTNVAVGHKWQKPLELFDRLVRCTVASGGYIVDPFCGSGTSLVAAKANGVDYLGIDNDKKSIELTEKRLSGEIPMVKLKSGQKKRIRRDIFGEKK